MKDFFISYNKADRAWAEWIAWHLEEADYTTTLQAWDFRPGSNFVLDMQRDAVEATRTIAVLSPDYLNALFTQPEWAAAFAQDPTGEKGTLLPVRVRECEIKGLLHPIVYIDLFNLEEAAAKTALLDGVKRGRAKPDHPPEFPGSTRTISTKPRFPGAMPAIWNVPHLRNPNFTGRQQELDDLRASLLKGETAALVQPRAIHGLGGVGKTQLAVEYAYRHAADYDAVWWVRSEDPTTLASDYAGLAAKLGLPEKDAAEQRLIVEAVKEWLRLNRGWLLVFDNAEDVTLVREYIPRGSAGHIIVTSRNPNWTGVATPLSVKALPIGEAVGFLLKRTGHQDSATAQPLAEALGCLPLALEQAGAYIEASHCTMAHYLELFETRQRELLERGKLSTEYPETVATTWSISFQNVENENPAAAELLRLCAFFAPNDIPIKMLVARTDNMPKVLAATVRDALLLDEALMSLRHYSLFEVENEDISIHPLVQAVIRHNLTEEELKKWIETATCIVDKDFPQESFDVRTWPQCVILLPHAISVLSHAVSITLATSEVAELLNQIALYLEYRAAYLTAKRMYELALSIAEAILGLDHPHTAVYANNLGSVLESLGDLAGSKACHERALAIAEAAFGLNDPRVATYVNNLGTTLMSLGDLAGAKLLFQRAIAIDESVQLTDHSNTAIRLNNLGQAFNAQGDLVRAKQLTERAFAMGAVAFGPDHPNVAIFANNLGQLLKAEGNLEGARHYLERALQILRAVLGDDHPYTTTTERNLRELLEGKGRSE